MAKATKSNKASTKEVTKMAKYIVEAPEPKKGQKASSGGIRENGRLTSHFKNPVLYQEPTLPPAVVTQKANYELFRKERARARRDEAVIYLLDLAWKEFVDPLLRSSLRKLRKTFIAKIEGPSTRLAPYDDSSTPEVIDIETGEIETVYDDDKIIRFPGIKVI